MPKVHATAQAAPASIHGYVAATTFAGCLTQPFRRLAGLVARMPELNHLAGTCRTHDVTKRDHRNIGASPHPAALGGIEREPEIANQNLVLIGCRYRALYKAEIVYTNIAFRSSDKEPLAMTSLLIAFPVPEMAAPVIAYGILR